MIEASNSNLSPLEPYNNPENASATVTDGEAKSPRKIEIENGVQPKKMYIESEKKSSQKDSSSNATFN